MATPENPRVSVIIPTYNRASRLPAALDSVLNQVGVEDLEYEVIVVDDGSTDNTAEVMERYRDQVVYKRLPQNTGRPAVVRNEAMRLAKGELIAFQDSDDVWVEDKFAAQISDFDDPKVMLSYGNCGFITPRGEIIPNRTAIDKAIPAEGYSFMRKISKLAAPTPTPSVMIRRSVIDKIGLFNEKLIIATDTDYFIRVASVGEYKYCDKVLVYMRRDGSNISARPDETGDEALYKHETNRIEMFKQLREELDLNADEDEAISYRIAELKRDVAEVGLRLGKDVPTGALKTKLPPKPKALREIENMYDEQIAYGQLDTLLKRLLGWWPALYRTVKRVARRIVKRIRRAQARRNNRKVEK